MTYGDRDDFDDLADGILEVRGKPARYYPADGSPAFDLLVTWSGGGATFDAMGEQIADIAPSAMGSRFALANATSEDVIEVVGHRWMVVLVTPDGGGFVRLKLHGPIVR